MKFNTITTHTTTRLPIPCLPPIVNKTFLTSFTILLTICLLLFVRSRPSTAPILTEPQLQADQHVECGFHGNNDAYGLGIRIAIYIQWITSVLITCFFEEGASSVIVITNCFQLSMLIALLYMTVSQGPDMQVSEAYLMLTIITGGALNHGIIDVRLFYPFDRKDAEAYTAALGSAIQVFIQLVLYFYWVWFVFGGMDHMQHPPCSRSAFLLARVDLYHWFRIFLMVVSVIRILSTVVLLVIQIDHDRSIRLPEPDAAPPASDSGSATESVRTSIDSEDLDMNGVLNAMFPKWLQFMFYVSKLFTFILAVELLIKWNHIYAVKGMGYTGRILPFVVSVGGFISVACQFLLQSASAERDVDVELGVVSN